VTDRLKKLPFLHGATEAPKEREMHCAQTLTREISEKARDRRVAVAEAQDNSQVPWNLINSKVPFSQSARTCRERKRERARERERERGGGGECSEVKVARGSAIGGVR